MEEPRMLLQQGLVEFYNHSHDKSGRFTGGRENRVAKQIVEGIQKRGGATIDPRTGQRVDKGYAVAGLTDAKMLSVSDVSTPAGRETAKTALKNWLKSEALKGSFDGPSVKVGAWVDGKEVWVEPSEQVMNREEAVRLGVSRNQKSIGDLAELSRSQGKRGYIDTGGTGEIQ